ncbi:MAG: tetratricopeptide repeat protein [Nitrospirota bacterium]|nr:MAG: tetratricopeptide repeat protein [Nitrospirota bacterium]
MKQLFFSTVLVFLLVLVSGGCDSGQYSQETKSEPKAGSQPMGEGEAPPAGEMAKVEGALMAPEGAPGASNNAEGVKHFEQGHWDVAKEHFDKALAANAKLAEAHYNLALALDKMGDHGEATNHFKTALELAPEDPRIKDSGILQAHVGG